MDKTVGSKVDDCDIQVCNDELAGVATVRQLSSWVRQSYEAINSSRSPVARVVPRVPFWAAFPLEVAQLMALRIG